MFNFVRLSEGGQPPVSTEMRSEVQIIASLAERILPANRFDWSELRSHRSLRAAIARTVPGYRAIGEMDGTGGEFHIAGPDVPRTPIRDRGRPGALSGDSAPRVFGRA